MGIYKSSGYQTDVVDETSTIAGISITCRKGDVFYILNNSTDKGDDPKPGRPAVVVSNDHLGTTSDSVCVVYMTTQPKRAMPEHVTLFSEDPKAPQSTVLCERINYVPKSRFGQFMRHLSDAEIERIDAALMISLGIKNSVVVSETACKQELTKSQEETKFYRRMCDYLTTQLKGSVEPS